MCVWLAGIASAVGTGMSIAGAVEGGDAEAKAARYRAGVSYERARRSDVAAWRTRNAGRREAGVKMVEGMHIEGAQAAAASHSGVDAEFGSAAVYRAQTDAYTNIDAAMIMYNAEIAAQEFEAEAEEHREAGRASMEVGASAQTAASLRAAGSGVGGLLHLHNIFDRAGYFGTGGVTTSQTGGTVVYGR